VASRLVRGGRVSGSCHNSSATRSITPPPIWVLSERYTLYPGMLNFFVGGSLVSHIAATSIEFAWRKISSSTFLLETEFAFHDNRRQFRVMEKRKNN